MPLSPYPYGGKRDGFITKIPEAGFNGIADITWEEDARMMHVR